MKFCETPTCKGQAEEDSTKEKEKQLEENQGRYKSSDESQRKENVVK